MATDSLVCLLAARQTVKTHSRVWINEKKLGIERKESERRGLAPIQGTVALSLNKYTQSYTHTQQPGELSQEPLFHADLLSRSNVWYAGIQALLNDLISMGLQRHRPVCVCVFWLCV